MNSKTILPFALIFMLLSCLATPLLAINSEAADDSSESLLLTVRLDGPSIIGADVKDDFVLRISYLYEERILNYSYTAALIGDNTVGGAVTPDNGTSSDGVFNLIITGASEKGTMTIEINATADEIDKTWYRVETFDIEVVNSVIIKASIENKGNAPANNVSVKMLVDGSLIEEKHISINPVSRIDLTFNWTFSTLSEGRHVITVIIDDPSGVVEFSEGNNVITKVLYYSISGNVLRGIIAIGIMFVAFVLIMTFLQKSTKKPKQ